MAEDNTTGNKTLTKAPLSALAAAATVALAGAVYAITSRSGSDDEADTVPSKGRSGGGMRKRVGLMTAIAVIENDTTRKLLLATLKLMAKRA